MRKGQLSTYALLFSIVGMVLVLSLFGWQTALIAAGAYVLGAFTFTAAKMEMNGEL